jgi:tetratricopeptide (TPR) repeat protein
VSRILEEVLDAGSIRLTFVYDTLGCIYKAQGEFEASESLFLKCLAIQEKEYGATSPKIAETYENCALLYDAMDQPDKATTYRARKVAAEKKE